MGVGYAGSLNLTVNEARDLGAALATDFFVLGDAQVLRRSAFEKPVYFAAYCSVFLVSARSGQLLAWERPSFTSAQANKAEGLLLERLADPGFSQHLFVAILRTNEDERIERTTFPAAPVPVLE